MTAPDLAFQACCRRLAPAGVCLVDEQTKGDEIHASFTLISDPRHTADCEISWFGSSGYRGQPGSEQVVQDVSGLMHVHGRDEGRPKPMRLHIASLLCGIIASDGVLAAIIGSLRGNPAPVVRTSPLQAALLLTSHYIAMATANKGWLPPPSSGGGPPFRSNEESLFEIETLNPEVWKSFWVTLGIEAQKIAEGWMRYCLRYPLATCSLPAEFQRATADHPLAEIEEIAKRTGITVVPVRGREDFVSEMGDWEGLPRIEPLSGSKITKGRVEPGGIEQTFTEEQIMQRPNPPGVEDPQPEVARPESRRASPEEPEGRVPLPLAGVKVIEVTTLVQGPLGGLLLSMLGAEVIKVEPPGGDPARLVPPLAGDKGAVFSCLNRGKTAVELDLSKQSGREKLRDLVVGADVFLNNWPPGRAEKWSLTAKDMGRVNPVLVYASATGWGPATGRQQLLATDSPAQAYSGLGELIRSDGERAPLRLLAADLTAGVVAAEGVLHGLLQRELSKKGVKVETSLVAAAAALHSLAQNLDDEQVPVTPAGHAPATKPASEAAASSSRATDITATSPETDSAATPSVAAATSTAARNDLASMPADPALDGLLEVLGGECFAAAAPWRFTYGQTRLVR